MLVDVGPPVLDGTDFHDPVVPFSNVTVAVLQRVSLHWSPAEVLFTSVMVVVLRSLVLRWSPVWSLASLARPSVLPKLREPLLRAGVGLVPALLA